MKRMTEKSKESLSDYYMYFFILGTTDLLFHSKHYIATVFSVLAFFIFLLTSRHYHNKTSKLQNLKQKAKQEYWNYFKLYKEVYYDYEALFDLISDEQYQEFKKDKDKRKKRVEEEAEDLRVKLYNDDYL